MKRTAVEEEKAMQPTASTPPSTRSDGGPRRGNARKENSSIKRDAGNDNAKRATKHTASASKTTPDVTTTTSSLFGATSFGTPSNAPTSSSSISSRLFDPPPSNNTARSPNTTTTTTTSPFASTSGSGGFTFNTEAGLASVPTFTSSSTTAENTTKNEDEEAKVDDVTKGMASLFLFGTPNTAAVTTPVHAEASFSSNTSTNTTSPFPSTPGTSGFSFNVIEDGVAPPSSSSSGLPIIPSTSTDSANPKTEENQRDASKNGAPSQVFLFGAHNATEFTPSGHIVEEEEELGASFSLQGGEFYDLRSDLEEIAQYDDAILEIPGVVPWWRYAAATASTSPSTVSRRRLSHASRPLAHTKANDEVDDDELIRVFCPLLSTLTIALGLLEESYLTGALRLTPSDVKKFKEQEKASGTAVETVIAPTHSGKARRSWQKDIVIVKYHAVRCHLFAAKVKRDSYVARMSQLENEARSHSFGLVGLKQILMRYRGTLKGVRTVTDIYESIRDSQMKGALREVQIAAASLVLVRPRSLWGRASVENMMGTVLDKMKSALVKPGRGVEAALTRSIALSEPTSPVVFLRLIVRDTMIQGLQHTKEMRETFTAATAAIKRFMDAKTTAAFVEAYATDSGIVQNFRTSFVFEAVKTRLMRRIATELKLENGVDDLAFLLSFTALEVEKNNILPIRRQESGGGDATGEKKVDDEEEEDVRTSDAKSKSKTEPNPPGANGPSQGNVVVLNRPKQRSNLYGERTTVNVVLNRLTNMAIEYPSREKHLEYGEEEIVRRMIYILTTTRKRRESELAARLHDFDLKIRKDSTFSQHFIDGNSSSGLEEVVAVQRINHHLFEYGHRVWSENHEDATAAVKHLVFQKRRTWQEAVETVIETYEIRAVDDDYDDYDDYDDDYESWHIMHNGTYVFERDDFDPLDDYEEYMW